MYRIAIVEDEKSSAEKLRGYIARYAAETNTELCSTVFVNGLDFIEAYNGNFDIMLMDIEMPHMNGLETAARLREIDEEVCLIFVTNLANLAIKGYAVRALDFLVKPVEYRYFCLKLQKAIELRSRRQTKELVLSGNDGIHKLRVDEIYYIEAMDHNLLYHTTQGVFEERRSIKEMEEKLSPYDFARASKSYLVNLKHISTMSGNTVTICREQIPIGRTKRQEFTKRLMDYLGDTNR